MSESPAQQAASMLERLLGHSVRVRSRPANWTSEPETASAPVQKTDLNAKQAEERAKSDLGRRLIQLVAADLRVKLQEGNYADQEKLLEAFDKAVHELAEEQG